MKFKSLCAKEICVIDEFGYLMKLVTNVISELMKLVNKGVYPIELWRNENEK